jgi:membrane carboxypeptidase/penicillin-binding protein
MAIGYGLLTAQLPSLETLPMLLEPPDGLLLHPTRLYDRTGEHVLLTLENPLAKSRKYLSLDENAPEHLPKWLIQAVIAQLDPAFWSHAGFSITGISSNQHPTLAQRLVNELLLSDEPPGIRRALRERLLAAQVTAHYGRDKVLEWYLNSANFGHLAYGADAAAWVYFNKSARDLDLAESAVLAAILDAPALNPLDAPTVVLERQKQVLQAMMEQGMISPEQFQQASAKEIRFREPVFPPQSSTEAFSNLVLEQLEQRLGRERLYRGGFSVVTTLDYDLQKQAECVTKIQLNRMSNVPQETAEENGLCPAARLLPTIPLPQEDGGVNLAANVIILDPTSGEILAMVGEPSLQDTVHSLGHPPGSLFTPIIYLAAFTRGFGPASLVWDIPSSLPAGLTDIGNPDGTFHGPVRLRIALANDYLVPAIQVMSQIGVENVWRTARQLGLVSLQIPEGSHAIRLPLGGGEVTLLDMVRAYGIFANQGMLVGSFSSSDASNSSRQTAESITVLKVTDGSGRVWMDCGEAMIRCERENRPIVTAQLAYLMTHVLSDEAARWRSLGHPNFLEIGRPAGAKIGVTQDGKDVWTIGYIPRLVVGVWVGVNSEDATLRLSPNIAAGLWHALMKYASKDRPYEDWNVPPGITVMEVCDPSGLLPTPDCPNVTKEVFQSGNEPTQIDTLFKSFQINRETGQLATIFTPPQLIEERVYMVVPPHAMAWARQVGLPTLPNSYDTVIAQSYGSDGAKIIQPSMFTNVSGQVSIRGTAFGDDFAYYRLLVGKGLNPQQWIQVGSEVSSPVKSGVLGYWDTSGLSGLYVLQLQVVHQNGDVETAMVQVTVDNQPPSLEIRYPHEDQTIQRSEEAYIAFQVDASDNMELSVVKFFLDGHLIESLTSSPFIVPWTAEIGEHQLQVQALDRAGNVSEDRVQFTVER